MGSFEFLDHMSDVYVEVQAKNISEAFEEAGKAVFETMTNIQSIEPNEKMEIKLEAEDKEALLFDWLGELIYIFDTKNKIFSKFNLKVLKKSENKFRLNAEIFGENFNPEKHEMKMDIKAPTYSLMEIINFNERVILRFVLDI